MTGYRQHLLYARSRHLPLALAGITGIALFTAWAARPFDSYADPYRSMVVTSLVPVLVAVTVGTSFHQGAEELERTAARPAWPWRLTHVLALTALAVMTLVVVVPGQHPEPFGSAALTRNTLGVLGITAGAAAVVGARLSWVPAAGYVGAVCLVAPGGRGGLPAVGAWPTQPGADLAGWVLAVGAFGLGTVLYAVRGGRPEGERGGEPWPPRPGPCSGVGPGRRGEWS